MTVPWATRFWSRVDTNADCWLWHGSVDKDGYGFFALRKGEDRPGNSNIVRAHRAAWFLANNEWPQSLVCHHCDTPGCVRISHLYQGSPLDNTRDASVRGRLFNMTKTHCPQGHPYAGYNVYTSQGRRKCRECVTTRNRNRRHAAQKAGQ